MRDVFRRFGLHAAVLLALSSSGCMVMDEMDSAAAKMPTSKKAKSESAVAGAKGDTPENPLVKQSKQWWESATSISSQGVDSGIARCQLAGGTQFMSRDDCRARGGTPSGV